MPHASDCSQLLSLNTLNHVRKTSNQKSREADYSTVLYITPSNYQTLYQASPSAARVKQQPEICVKFMFRQSEKSSSSICSISYAFIVSVSWIKQAT